MGLRFCTDLITDTGASGWVVGDSARPLTVEAWCEGQLVGQTHPDRSRPEVAAGLGINSFGENTGFSISFEIPQVPRDILIEIKCGSTTIGANCVLPKLARDKIARAQFQSNTPLSPFPRPIFAAIRKIWPNEIDDAEAVVRRIGVLAANPQCASLPFVADYARYVRLVWAHCQFVSKYFPANSDSGDPSAKDYNWKPNSPEEIMSIAHHLYVLKSYGISGAFAEFGCFKGFSSAMLSYACDLLGIKMHIFDSFKGLPASSSGYYRPGEFSGSLKEVRRNIEQFGSLRPVTFHKGFFDQSIPSANLRELMCLWMDVDLETSAKDVMKIARKLNKRGTIFSHECYPSNFNHGSIIATRSVNSVLPPVVDQFKKLGSELAGQFVFGNTGALWRKRVGCPVLPIGALKVLIGATEYEQAQRAITHLATERSALTASRDQAQGALKQSQAEFEQAQGEIVHLEAERSALAASLDQAQGALKQSRADYEQTQGAIVHLKAERSALAASLDQAQGALKQSRVEFEQAQDAIMHLDAERSALAGSLDAMRNSTSWRVTRPLRQFRLMAARLFGR